MDEYLHFENTIFFNFLRFSAHNLSLLRIFFPFFIFNNVLTTVNTHIAWLIKYMYLPLKSKLCLNLIIPNIIPLGLIFGRSNTWKEFSISKVGF